MKKSILILQLFFLHFSICFALPSQLELKKIDESLLVRILNNSERNYKEQLKFHAIRIYSIPSKKGCKPKTPGYCVYEYYLAISEYDESPDQTIYFLGYLGEFTKLTYIPTQRSLHERENSIIELEFKNYSDRILKHYKIKEEVSKLKFNISIDRIILLD